jgi:hypothetical protein
MEFFLQDFLRHRVAATELCNSENKMPAGRMLGGHCRHMRKIYQIISA